MMQNHYKNEEGEKKVEILVTQTLSLFSFVLHGSRNLLTHIYHEEN